jgi:hypothetical protein
MNELHQAAIAGDLDAVRAAVASGIPIPIDSVEEKHGNSALMLAAYNNHPSVLSWLLGAGAVPDVRCYEHNTALMKAAWSGATECVVRLIRAGADVNAAEQEGMTPLMIAAFHGHFDVVKVLLGAGAEVNRADNQGHTALRNARKRGHAAVAAQLEKLANPLRPSGSGHHASGDNPTIEASMNFDVCDLQPFLEALARRIERGFSLDVARELASDIARLAVDSECEWAYSVVFNGSQMPLRVAVFMDDVDAPDVAMFAPAPLIEAIETEMRAYFR